jgi:hypothetical protein
MQSDQADLTPEQPDGFDLSAGQYDQSENPSQPKTEKIQGNTPDELAKSAAEDTINGAQADDDFLDERDIVPDSTPTDLPSPHS